MVKIDAGEALPFIKRSALDNYPSKISFVVGTNSVDKNFLLKI
jgi:hypothetical protein